MSVVPQDPVDRDALATVFGAVCVALGAAGMYLELLPWYAGVAAWAVGLYLALPRRMRVVGDQVVSAIRKIRGVK